MEYRKYALAIRCNFQRRCEPDIRQTGGAESERDTEMEFEYSENDRNIPPKLVDEEKAFCDQYGSRKVPGRSIGFLKEPNDTGRGWERFMRMSWQAEGIC